MEYHVSVVAEDPIIVHCFNYGGKALGRLPDIMFVLGRDAAVTFTVSLPASLFTRRGNGEYKLDQLAREYRDFKSYFQNADVCVCANDPLEYQDLRLNGVPAVYCNHNAFINRKLFPILDEKKRYDAVINGRFDPSKRFDLASKVDSVAAIIYNIDPDYADRLIGRMPNVDFVQMRKGEYAGYLSVPQVNRIYAMSRCGLALSAIEGACFASVEYLLAGLPVVTTNNLGGRNVFFHPDYVAIAPPTPLGVREAVRKALSFKVSPEEIRTRTIALMDEHLMRYCVYLRTSSGGRVTQVNFTHKMTYALRDMVELIAYLRKSLPSHTFPS